MVANGRKEKIASGLLNPFVAHLKVAQEQIAKGGYSITLEPDPEVDVPWFTRGTVERLVLGFSLILPPNCISERQGRRFCIFSFLFRLLGW